MSGLIWQRKFKRGEARATLQREATLNIIIQGPPHLSAEEIFLLLKRNYPGIGIATVYRTLNFLTRRGVVNKFDFGDGRSRYELAEESKKDHHHHLVCTKCGRIVNYSNFLKQEIKFVQELEKELTRKHKFRIHSHQLHFYGICRECQ